MPTAPPTAEVYSSAWMRSPRARSTRPACARSSPAGSSGAPVDFFVDAVERTSPARAAYLAGDWGAVASLSPELFLRRAGEAVTSSPIKGTLPRTCGPGGAAGVGQGCRREHHDRRPGPQRPEPRRGDGLGDRARTARGAARSRACGIWCRRCPRAVPLDVPMAALLEAAFPPASVTGTPKLRARQLLTGWEPHRRGVYCGTVGLASPVAGCELNVAIRTVEFGADGSAVLGVGGGITADSDPDREWDECLHKAAPIVGAMRSADSARRGSRPAVPAR